MVAKEDSSLGMNLRLVTAGLGHIIFAFGHFNQTNESNLNFVNSCSFERGDPSVLVVTTHDFINMIVEPFAELAARLLIKQYSRVFVAHSVDGSNWGECCAAKHFK
jgi:hypothetical protein